MQRIAHGRGCGPARGRRSRRSRHPRRARAVERARRRAPVVFRGEILVFRVRRLDEVVELARGCKVAAARRVVRVDEHPLAKNKLGVGGVQARRRAVRRLGAPVAHPGLQRRSRFLGDVAVRGGARDDVEQIRVRRRVRRRGQLPEEDRVVEAPEQRLEAAPERPRRTGRVDVVREAELLAVAVVDRLGEDGVRVVRDLLERRDVVEERREAPHERACARRPNSDEGYILKAARGSSKRGPPVRRPKLGEMVLDDVCGVGNSS
mmetsp:Transcript_10773/g.33238  ORF Transcript_10773/g.33238 Transcript_10773/m.33238 type:complete len:263 (+) Transcript_10773:155-943(+)